MSKLAKKPLQIPDGINVILKDGVCTMSNGKNSIELKYNYSILDIELKDKMISVTKKNSSKDATSQSGTIFRTIKSSITGLLPAGFSFNVNLKGVGYKAVINGNLLFLTLGYSHNIALEIPQDVSVKVEKNTALIIQSYTKGKAMDFIKSIQRLRSYNVYKGSGVLLENEWRVTKEMKKSKK